MKKILALLLVVCMILSAAVLTGCGDKSAADATTAPDDTETDAATEAEAVSTIGALPLRSFTATAGDYELNFEPIDLGFVQGGENTSKFTGEYYDGKYYLSDERTKKLYIFAIDGTTATLENTLELEKGFEKISVNNEGKVILSQGIFEAYELNDDGTVTKLPYKHDVECSKTQDFAVTTWVNADPTIIVGGEESAWVFKNVNDDTSREGNLSMVFDCEIEGDLVYIGGTFVEDGENDYRIGIFDFDGNQQAMTAVGDGTGYSALNVTANGIISANVSKLYLHDSSCNPLGKIDDLKKAAGFDSETVKTFWVQDFAVGEDGVYMLVYASKADDTKEALLYKVTGF